jgi:hypothetical protein
MIAIALELRRVFDMGKMTKEEALRHLGGSVDEIDRDLREFAEAAKVLSSKHPRLIDEHALEWVGIYDGEVAASGQTLTSLKTQLEQKGIPPKKAIIRFIDKEERTFIL